MRGHVPNTEEVNITEIHTVMVTLKKNIYYILFYYNDSCVIFFIYIYINRVYTKIEIWVNSKLNCPL